MRASGSTIKPVAKALFSTRMAESMRGNGATTRPADLEFTLMQTAASMKATGKTMTSTDKALKRWLMGPFTKVCTRTEINTEWEFTFGLTVVSS